MSQTAEITRSYCVFDGDIEGDEALGVERSSEHDAGQSGPVERSPYAIAQDGLAELVDASVHAQRVEAMNAAVRVDLIFLTLSYALRAEAAFVAPSLSPERRREMVHRSVTAELATALHVPEPTMQRLIDEAWALSTRLPATLSALRAGSISQQHARVVVEATVDLDDERQLRADLDAALAAFAVDHTAPSLRRKARSLREELRAETVAERHLAARAKRRVEIEPALDGMAWLHAYLPAADALLIKDRLDRVVRGSAALDGVAHPGIAHDGDARNGIAGITTADQTRADAARDLLLHGSLPAESRFADAVDRVRPSVHLTVPALTVMGESEAPGELRGYGPIDAGTARRLAAKAPSFTRILTHPVTGTLLDVDRATYRPPADLKRWLQVRDEACRFPDCARPAVASDIDHTIDWADGGGTSAANLAHLCAMHHHLKHETSWSVHQRPEGVLEWRSPAGRSHVSRPARTFTARAGASPPVGLLPESPPF